jgi:D-galactarolactone cycloisomerase
VRHGGDVIATAEVIHVRKALSVPAGPPGHYNEARESIFLKLTTRGGVTGWGETYALPGVQETIRGLADLVVGADPLQILGSWCPPWVATVSSPSARAAIDIALHDLCGTMLGTPAYELLGGSKRDRVRAYASDLLYIKGEKPGQRWLDRAGELADRGFTAIKVRIGGFAAKVEIPLLENLRREGPPQARLMVDAWGAYSQDDALRVGRVLQDCGYSWFEEPMPPEPDHGGYAELAHDLLIPVAGGEMVADRSYLRRLLERRAFDVVQPDVCIAGGMREVLFAAELADLMGVECVPHTWNGGVMNAATMHVIAAMPFHARQPGSDHLVLEYDTTENPFMREVLSNPPELRDGCFEVPSAPGLGVRVDEERLRALAV